MKRPYLLTPDSCFLYTRISLKGHTTLPSAEDNKLADGMADGKMHVTDRRLFQNRKQ